MEAIYDDGPQPIGFMAFAQSTLTAAGTKRRVKIMNSSADARHYVAHPHGKIYYMAGGMIPAQRRQL
jgi:hypothetical protein